MYRLSRSNKNSEASSIPRAGVDRSSGREHHHRRIRHEVDQQQQDHQEKLTRPERKLALQCTSMCLGLVKRDQELLSEIGDPELRTDALALYFESEERIFRA